MTELLYAVTLNVRARSATEAQRMAEIAQRAVNRTLDYNGRLMSAKISVVRPTAKCPTCGGAGVDGLDGMKCSTCHGTGEIEVPPRKREASR